MAITENGRDLWANALCNAANGYHGTATAYTANSLTAATAKFKAFGGHEWLVGKIIVVGKVFGTITEVSSETEVKISRWEVAGEIGLETAAATPSGSQEFVVPGGAAPALWMALSVNKTAVTKPSKETELKEEIQNVKPTSEENSMGLVRTVVTWEHTKGSNQFKLVHTFEAKTNDKLPVTIGKIGVFNCGYTVKEGKTEQPKGSVMLFETELASSATLAEKGDSVTITDTVEGT
jgi:hypothetical protein